MKELIEIQEKLRAPKSLYNKFGGYSFRSAEGILEAVKPLLKAMDCVLTLSDEPVMVGERYYIKATATLTNKDNQIVTTTAYAREEEALKGQIAAQITGGTSSYARKYALNGLFCIDDNQDPDMTNDHGKGPAAPAAKPASDNSLEVILQDVKSAKSLKEVNAIWREYKDLQDNATFKAAVKVTADKYRQQAQPQTQA